MSKKSGIAAAFYAALSVAMYFIYAMPGYYSDWMFYLSLLGGPTSALLTAHDFQTGSTWFLFPSPFVQYLVLTLALAALVLLAWRTERLWLRCASLGIYWMLAGAISTYFNAMSSL